MPFRDFTLCSFLLYIYFFPQQASAVGASLFPVHILEGEAWRLYLHYCATATCRSEEEKPAYNGQVLELSQNCLWDSFWLFVSVPAVSLQFACPAYDMINKTHKVAIVKFPIHKVIWEYGHCDIQ